MDYRNPNYDHYHNMDDSRWNQGMEGNRNPGPEERQNGQPGGSWNRGEDSGWRGGQNGGWNGGADSGWNGGQNGGWNGGADSGWRGGQNGSWNGETGRDYEKRVLKETRRCFSRVGLVYTGYLVMTNLSQVAVMTFLLMTGIAAHMGSEIYMLTGILSMYPAAVPLTALFIKWAPKKGNVGQESWSLGKLCGFFVAAMGVLYIGNIIGNIFMEAASRIKGEPILNDLDTLVMSMKPWALFAAVVIAAPVMEELVFRKFLLDRIAGYGYRTAMLVSGLLFGIAHGNFYQFFYAFGLGVVFSYIYLRTGKIAYTIVFHMLINFWGSLMPLGLLKLIEEHVFFGVLLALCNMMLVAGFIICSIILMVVCRRDIVLLPPCDGFRGGKRTAAVLGNLGMILFLICGIGLFIYSF